MGRSRAYPKGHLFYVGPKEITFDVQTSAPRCGATPADHPGESNGLHMFNLSLADYRSMRCMGAPRHSREHFFFDPRPEGGIKDHGWATWHDPEGYRG